MIPTTFKEANIMFHSPPDVGNCEDVSGWQGEIRGGKNDGVIMSVVAWQPDERDRERIAQGSPIFLAVFGRMVVHNIATEIQVKIE